MFQEDADKALAAFISRHPAGEEALLRGGGKKVVAN